MVILKLFMYLYFYYHLPGLPNNSTIATYSIFHIGALLMVIGLIRIDTERHWYSFQDGRQLTTMAHTDPLTGVYNRRVYPAVSLSVRLKGKSVTKNGTRQYVLLILIAFKNINDSYGHSIGDEVLQLLVKRCLNVIRETDTLARTGGEEFVVMLPETSSKEALETAERLRTAICNEPFHTAANGLDISVSIGIAVLEPGQLDFTYAMNKADRAMYQAKNEGRNRVVLAE
ncbi:MAG: GGDEF domain-containing protein [Gammaproteobacteria bacterium]|nr:GGDEF domain-containing protein [Gammaproteobacteria bacterium]